MIFNVLCAIGWVPKENLNFLMHLLRFFVNKGANPNFAPNYRSENFVDIDLGKEYSIFYYAWNNLRSKIDWDLNDKKKFFDCLFEIGVNPWVFDKFYIENRPLDYKTFWQNDLELFRAIGTQFVDKLMIRNSGSSSSHFDDDALHRNIYYLLGCLDKEDSVKLLDKFLQMGGKFDKFFTSNKGKLTLNQVDQPYYEQYFAANTAL